MSGGRRRRWELSSGTSVVVHLVVGVAASVLTAPSGDRLAGRHGDLALDERESIPIDLVPFAEAAPAQVSPPRKEELAPPAAHRRRPPSAPVVAPPPARSLEEELVDAFPQRAGEAAAAGALYGTLTAAAPVRVRLAVVASDDQPLAISAAEASYLRTYETFPNLPASLWVTGRSYEVMAQVCVSNDGRVTGVSIKDGGARDLEQVITASVRSWRYQPRFVGGQPRPFCHLIRFVYSVRR